MQKAAILVSPGPVDGYPPVQNQARLFAEAGFAVTLITTIRGAAQKITFAHPGVNVRCIDCAGTGLRTTARSLAFINQITRARARYARVPHLEVVFDPLGMLYSDYAMRRPSTRIAHFHESLQHFETHRVERRLSKAISAYEMVVVPDEARGELIREKLQLEELPIVVPNYPYREPEPYKRQPRDDNQLEVVYSGSIGFSQKLDLITESVADWPNGARLTIYGDAEKPVAKEIEERTRMAGLTNRIEFAGWLDIDELRDRIAVADLGISLLDASSSQWQSALGASNKRYQYMQAGLPQIGDMNPGVPELIEGNSIGRCLTRFDKKELARLVEFYVGNPVQREQQGREARKLHLERFNYQAAFGTLLDTIGHSFGVDQTH